MKKAKLCRRHDQFGVGLFYDAWLILETFERNFFPKSRTA